MKMLTVERVLRAVKSISTTSSPMVQVQDIIATATRLHSPYVSRTEIEYTVGERLPSWAVFAASPRYALLITKEDSSPRQLVSPYPIGGYVNDWEYASVPSVFIRPVFEVFQKVHLDTDPQDFLSEPMVSVYVLSPLVAAFHFNQPVFLLADGDKNTPLSVTMSEAGRQGHLVIGRPEGLDWRKFASWNTHAVNRNPLFYNHRLVLVGPQPDAATVEASTQYLRPVAVKWNDDYYAAVRVVGPCTIVARDGNADGNHPDLSIGAVELLVLHPLKWGKHAD